MSNGTRMLGAVIHAMVTVVLGVAMICVGLLAISAWLM